MNNTNEALQLLKDGPVEIDAEVLEVFIGRGFSNVSDFDVLYYEWLDRRKNCEPNLGRLIVRELLRLDLVDPFIVRKARISNIGWPEMNEKCRFLRVGGNDKKSKFKHELRNRPELYSEFASEMTYILRSVHTDDIDTKKMCELIEEVLPILNYDYITILFEEYIRIARQDNLMSVILSRSDWHDDFIAKAQNTMIDALCVELLKCDRTTISAETPLGRIGITALHIQRAIQCQSKQHDRELYMRMVDHLEDCLQEMEITMGLTYITDEKTLNDILMEDNDELSVFVGIRHLNIMSRNQLIYFKGLVIDSPMWSKDLATIVDSKIRFLS